MREYTIVTDSASDLPAYRARELGVEIIPLTVTLGGESFQDIPGAGPDSKVFYDRLKAGESVQTSAPNVEEFTRYFRPILEQGRDILYLGFSSALSATCANGRLALGELGEEFSEAVLLTVDTLCASLGQGLLVDLAAKARERGMGIEELRDYVEEQKKTLAHWFTVGYLDQLRRGGRLSAGKALLGTLLHVKPVLHVADEGTLVPMETVKGRKKAIDALLRRMEATVVEPGRTPVYIVHSDCREEAEELARRVKEKFPVEELIVGDMGPVIGAHCGRGTIALFFVGTSR